MKKILFKAFEEDGQRTYVYELPEEAELDEDALDLCEDGALRGIVPMEYVDDADAFYYNVSGYKTLGKALSGEVDSSDVLEALYGVARILIEFKENNISIAHLVLHKDFIFIDRMTMEVKFLCVPLEEDEPENMLEDVSRFVRVLLSGLTYDISEDGSYVTKLLTLVNTEDQFNISIFVNALQDLMSEYGVPFEEIEISESYVDYENDDISTIDASILESLPESVSVAEMEAEALRSEAEAEETEEYVEEAEAEETEGYVEEAEAEDAEGYVEEAEAEDAEGYVEEAEAEEYAEEAGAEETEEYVEEAEAEETEEYVEETEAEETEEYVEETEAEEAEEYAEEAQAEETDTAEPVAGIRADTVGNDKKGKFAKKSSGVAASTPAEEIPVSNTEVKSDAEIKRMQQEALRKIAEAENLDSFPGKKKSLEIDIDGMNETSDNVQESEDGNTEVLKPEKKPHKLELAKETIVRPVFDSVFEPIIESIDGPIDGDEMPRAYVTTVPKPAKNPAKSAKAARAKAKSEGLARSAKKGESEEENASILSQEVSAASEPSLLSQLDNRTENLPKVNPYLIRVNNEERIMITKTSFKIGKASFGMDYTVTDNGAISRNHCLIFAKDGVYYIRDNKSTNHTYVNGQIVKNGQDVVLTHESTIRIADEDFLFKLR